MAYKCTHENGCLSKPYSKRTFHAQKIAKHLFIRLWTTLGSRWTVEAYVRTLYDAKKGKKYVHEDKIYLQYD